MDEQDIFDASKRSRSEFDEKLVSLYEKRDEEASALTEKQYGKALMRQAKNLLGNEEDAEECVNDTYFAAWCSIPPDSPVYFFAYLSEILRRKCIDMIRKRTASKRGNIQELSEELCDILPSSSDTESDYDSSLIRDTINSFLRSQDDRKRRVFVLRYWYSESVKTIAAREGVSEDAISSLLARTRRELKEELAKEGIE